MSIVFTVRPAAFGFNPQTQASNTFQHDDVADARCDVATAALAEFDGVVELLRTHGVTVIVFPDLPEPPKPDAVFPNNWCVRMHAQ